MIISDQLSGMKEKENSNNQCHCFQSCGNRRTFSTCVVHSERTAAAVSYEVGSLWPEESSMKVLNPKITSKVGENTQIFFSLSLLPLPRARY